MEAHGNGSGDGEKFSSFGKLNDFHRSSPLMHSRLRIPYINRDGYADVNMPSIEILPDECLSEILKRLPRAQERCILACVSKRWLTLLTSLPFPDLRRKTKRLISVDGNSIHFTSLSNAVEVFDDFLERTLEGAKATDISLAAIALGTGSRGGLGKLSIRGSNPAAGGGVTSYGLSAIGHGCPALKNLLLFNIPTIDDNGLIEIAKGCPLLEKLDFAQCPTLTNKGLVALAYRCRGLTTINFESCFGIGNTGLKSFGRHCPKLQSIGINNCPLIGDQGVVSLFALDSNALTSLKLQSLDITDLSLAVISTYGAALRTLVLSGLQKISEKGFCFIGSSRCLQFLTSIKLSSFNMLTNRSLEAVGQGCPNLKCMVLHNCYFESDNGLVAFATAARYLHSLELVQCHGFTQVGVLWVLSQYRVSNLKSLFIMKCLGFNDMPLQFQILYPCQSLLSLTLKSCPGLTSASLALLGKACPRLHNLDLSGLAEITDEGLMPFLETYPKRLDNVNVAGCVNLTDKSIVAMARLHGTTLRVINLDGCTKVTDESLYAMAYDCYVIKELHVSLCSITDTGLAPLCDAFYPDFEVLSISGCSMISDKSVHYIKMLSHTLKTLNIENCKSISTRGVDELKRELRSCDIMF